MSADNGYILRKNTQGLYCLQEYCASDEQLPKISKTSSHMLFRTVEEAIRTFQQITESQIVEYGLSVDISKETDDEHKEDCPYSIVKEYILTDPDYDRTWREQLWINVDEIMRFVQDEQNRRCSCGD